MAIIDCTECGHVVSDKAKLCMNCGCPVSEILKEIESRKILNNGNLLLLEEFISENGILEIPQYIEEISFHIRWPKLLEVKNFNTIIIHNSVKTINRLAFIRLRNDVDIIFLDKTGYDYEFIRFLNAGKVAVNYENEYFQDKLCSWGVKYILYDKEESRFLEYTERGVEVENNDNKIFYAPFITEQEKAIFHTKLVNKEDIIIPDTIRMLKQDDFQWKRIERDYEEKCKGKRKKADHLPLYIDLWIGKNVEYIDACFFYSDDENSPVYIGEGLTSDCPTEYRPNRLVNCHCEEDTYAGERLLELEAEVHFRNSEGYDTRIVDGRIKDEIRVLCPLWYCKREWTDHNTNLELDKIMDDPKYRGVEKVLDVLRIPDEYNCFSEFGIYYSYIPINKLVFGKNMIIDHLSSDLHYWKEGIKEIYIPFKCMVAENAFEDIKQEVTIFCEEGSSAEIAAKFAKVKYKYYDFKENKTYKKGQRNIRVLHTAVSDIYLSINDNIEIAETVLKVLMRGYDILALKMNGDREERRIVLEVLQKTGIEYTIFD